MNQFEIRANALRLRYKAEREQMQKAFELHVGHMNTAIGQVTLTEGKEALRAEKERVKEAHRQSMEWHKRCYLQKVALLNEDRCEYYRHNPSNRTLRRAAV